jgi:hypothetical protein
LHIPSATNIHLIKIAAVADSDRVYSIFHIVDSDMSIAMIRRGGAHGTRINHQKRNNQRELDAHGQYKCRRQEVLSLSGLPGLPFHFDDALFKTP